MNRPVYASNWKVDKALPVGETNNERRKVSPRFSSFTGSEMKNLRLSSPTGNLRIVL
jgi:hypothetical protein